MFNFLLRIFYPSKYYNKLFHSICDEVNEKKIIDIFLSVPQEERDRIFKESF
jgi:hypothetical protein